MGLASGLKIEKNNIFDAKSNEKTDASTLSEACF
jgi:hypothetical protein